ncbi:translation machinery-associated [Ramicandelaber brevisporus]|nr:translation machinery-associated [Ramicandelaber brevisporus]
MFKKFTEDDVTNRTNIKASVQRGLRTRLIEQFPALDQNQLIDELLPKSSKQSVRLLKCRDGISLFALGPELLFIQHFDEPLIPSLRLVHQFPSMTKSVQMDHGAIKHILGGAHVMCPGLTNNFAKMEDKFKAGDVVAVYANGKENALAIGIAKMSDDEIRTVNKGIAIEVVHVLGDGLWQIAQFD